MESFQKEFDCIRERSFVNMETIRNLRIRLENSIERLAVLADFFFLSLAASLKVVSFSYTDQ